jgi:hypothetical protein
MLMTLARPGALELVEVIEQPVGVVGDLQVPLRELLLLGDRTPHRSQRPIDDLLVREHGLVVRAPVDPAVLAVGEALLEHLEEEPLVPLVVLGVARVQHAVPVERRGVQLHAALLLVDVLVGPRARVDAALDGRVLGRETERVPTDGVEHVEALLSPVASDDITEGVGLGMPHVQVAGRIREHVEDVLARLRVVAIGGAEGLGLVPDRLPLLLHGVEVVLGTVVVLLGHRCSQFVA